MRKLMLLAALLAMLAVAAIPAIAQVGQESEQEGEAGDLDQEFNITGGGDNSNSCVGIQGVGNTGNVQNQIDVLQYGQGVAGEGDSGRDGDNDRKDGDNDRKDRDHDRNNHDGGGGEGGSFEFDEVKSSIELNPENSTECTSEVNQAASASYTPPVTYPTY
jgi:hypothetical protein